MCSIWLNRESLEFGRLFQTSDLLWLFLCAVLDLITSAAESCPQTRLALPAIQALLPLLQLVQRIGITAWRSAGIMRAVIMIRFNLDHWDTLHPMIAPRNGFHFRSHNVAPWWLIRTWCNTLGSGFALGQRPSALRRHCNQVTSRAYNKFEAGYRVLRQEPDKRNRAISFQLFNGIYKDRVQNPPGIGALAIATGKSNGDASMLLLLEQNKVQSNLLFAFAPRYKLMWFRWFDNNLIALAQRSTINSWNTTMKLYLMLLVGLPVMQALQYCMGLASRCSVFRR